jgi:class 3 adenylate cyclase
MTAGETNDVERFARADLYDPDETGADERLALLRLNADHGVTIEEMVESRDEGRLALLAGRRVNLGGATPLSLRDIATRTDEPIELLGRIWRAVGFAEPDPDEPMYTEESLELLDLFRTASEIYGEDVTLQLARVIGSSIARIADAEVTAFVQNIAAPLAEERKELAIAQAHVQLASLNPPLARALDLAHRYHCEAALQRVALVPGAGQGKHLAVGFADLVGFASLSQTLPGRELAAAISEFESRASETVTAAGGRVIKLIGDEVMFVADDSRSGCEVALRLVEVFRDDELLPPVRGGLASGDTITQEGDYFGPVVNLAARATKIARPESVLVPEALTREMPDSADFSFRRVGARRLKGFAEPVTLYALQRSGGAIDVA